MERGPLTRNILKGEDYLKERVATEISLWLQLCHQLFEGQILVLVRSQRLVRQDLSPYVDLALHDLMGVILDKPVYQLIGANGTKKTPIYSGMIYFDELEPEDNPAGMDKIIENCQWDIDYGYRQLKVKIGRSGMWYPHDEGLK